MTPRRIAMLAVVAASSLAVAACGSSKSSSSSGGAAASSSSSSGGSNSSSSSGGSGTINGAGSTLAAPIYQQWASTLKGQGVTVNFNPVGSGAGQTELETATVDFAGQRPVAEASGHGKMKGAVLQFPVAAGAITVSYNLSGVKSGLKLDGPTIAKIFHGPDQDLERPGDQVAEPGMSLPSTAITVVHRSDSSGTTAGLHRRSCPTSTRPGSPRSARARTSSGRPGPGGEGTRASPRRSSRPPARSATSSRRTRWRTASRTRRSRTRAARTSCRRSPTPRPRSWGSRSRRTSGSATINSPNPGAYPIVSQTFLDAYKDPCKDGGASARHRQPRSRSSSRTRSGPASRRSARARASSRTRRCRRRWPTRTTRSSRRWSATDPRSRRGP